MLDSKDLNIDLNIGDSDVVLTDKAVGNKDVSFIIKKSLRLSNAILYISSKDSANKNLKDKIEYIGLDLNRQCTSILSEKTDKLGEALSNLRHTLIGLLNLINSLLIIKGISQGNQRVVSAEISTIVNTIEKELNKDHENSIGAAVSKEIGVLDGNIPKEFFGVITKSHRHYFRRQKNNITKNEQDYNNVNSNKNLDNTGVDVHIQDPHKQQVMSKSNVNEQQLNTRQEAIIKILKDKDSSVIKDISTRIKDYSEKTIQRELNFLVDMGLVSKSGERRWTRYTARVI